MENSRNYQSNYYLIALLIIGSFAAIIEVLSYIIYRARIWYLELLFIIIVFLSTQVVYKDAQKIDAGEAYPQQKTFRSLTWTPASWATLVFVIWIIFFPLYLFMREDIFWRNISVEYHTLKTIERDIKIQNHKPQELKQPSSNESKYEGNVRTCPSCGTPYPVRMLERSKYCNRCGGLLTKDD